LRWAHRPEEEPRMPIAEPTADELELLQEEAVRFTRELIRIDTTNYVGNDPATWGRGEKEAAEHVVRLRREVGLDPMVIESHPGLPTVFVRSAGDDRQRGGMIISIHLYVVAAQVEYWSVHPCAAETHDGMIYGRGAVDMKDMVAMILALARHLAR